MVYKGVKKGPYKSGMKKKKFQRVPVAYGPDRVFVQTHIELLTELQMKYTGLYNLSMKTNHKLLEAIAKRIMERLKNVSETAPDALTSGFELSKAYRRLHPHFGDFQLILTNLHKLQDAAGAPRTQMAESDLISVPTGPYAFDNVPFDKVQSACGKYSDKIAKKIASHISSLQTEISPEDTEEEIARKKVREELKKLSPFMTMIIRDVISEHFIPRKAPFHKLRIYGEPFMPHKDAMAPIMKRHRAISIRRSDRMYNLLRFNMPLIQYNSIMAMDGSVINGAKLVIRSSEAVLYSPTKSLIAEMRSFFGIEHNDADQELIVQEQEDPDCDDEVLDM